MQINKKIICILLLFFAFAVYAEDSITYEVLVKSDIYSDSTGRVYKKTKKGEKITTTFPTPIGFDDYINEDNQTKFLFFKENKEYYGIQIKNIKIANSDSLPSELVNFDSTGLTRMVIPSYYLKVLSNQNAKEILNYEKTYARYIAKNNETDVLGNRIQNSPDEFSATISSIYINLNSGDEIYFKKFTKISDSVYECEGISHIGYTYENHDHSENFWQVWVDNTPEGQTEVFTLTVDGDFLHIDNKTRNKHIITLAYVDNSVIQELINLFMGEKCDLTKVTWPRHADATCDYDGTKKTATNKTSASLTSSLPATNVSQNKTMTIKENLKLRSGEATSTQVLTVMQAGSKVKILELGKAETIDGINSNWVKVEVQTGAKDRDGKPIKAGTVGWCYGGYLQ